MCTDSDPYIMFGVGSKLHSFLYVLRNGVTMGEIVCNILTRLKWRLKKNVLTVYAYFKPLQPVTQS